MTGRPRRSESATPQWEAWRSRFISPPGSAPRGSTSLSRDFFAGPSEVLAPALLGLVVRSSIGGEVVAGRIVETEAYTGPDDPASHAARRIGRTRRNESMFGPPGTGYVYFIYGMHWCFNVVVAEVDDPQAVLIRALEPLDGLEVMARRRGKGRDLTNGPARLCQALGIDGDLDGHDLTRPPLQLLPGAAPAGSRVRTSGRVGIRRARDRPLRFFLADDPHVSTGPHLELET